MEQENQNVETETTTETTNVETENNSADVVKKFTQDEVNNIVKERLAKAQKGIPSKEELAEYNKWKESQKTQQDKYDELVKKDTEKDNTITNLQKENLVLKSGIIDQDEVEFIVYKVSKIEGDFEENLKNYLAENPKHTKKQETKATGVENNNKASSPSTESGVSAILKAKHPELFE
jgi:hypothetical protein